MPPGLREAEQKMKKTKTIKIGEQSITATELTAAQVKELLFGEPQPDRPLYVAESLINSPVPIEVVAASTGLDVELLEGDMPPSDLAEIWKAVEVVNGFLFSLCERLSKAVAKIDPGKLALNKPSAP